MYNAMKIFTSVPAQFFTALTTASVLVLMSLTATAMHHEKDEKVDMQSPDIIDIASASNDFGTLTAAIKRAELYGALKADGPFTVFAPTDQAFAKLPEGTVESLLEPENVEHLRAVLTYHVVPGKVTASDVVSLNSAKTVNGDEVKIRVEDGSVFINNAKVIKTDITASNGVIHVVDEVIMPPKS